MGILFGLVTVEKRVDGRLKILGRFVRTIGDLPLDAVESIVASFVLCA